MPNRPGLSRGEAEGPFESFDAHYMHTTALCSLKRDEDHRVPLIRHRSVVCIDATGRLRYLIQLC